VKFRSIAGQGQGRSGQVRSRSGLSRSGQLMSCQVMSGQGLDRSVQVKIKTRSSLVRSR